MQYQLSFIHRDGLRRRRKMLWREKWRAQKAADMLNTANPKQKVRVVKAVKAVKTK